ncbi:MAG TPA: MinD/ParA family protein [Chitinispirillaceae bacterium]|nr:MinD/ParA family protein [Chitinispirillaceae bacterium]
MNDQAEKLREMARNHTSMTANASAQNNNSPEIIRCKSIAVTSGKGGVGKTNVAISLAVTLASFRKKVLLMDADLGLANVHILLGLAPSFNLSHFFDKVCLLDQVIIRGVYGIDILPGASGFEKLANLDQGRLEFLQHSFHNLEQQYDYMIIDTGAGIGANVVRFASKTDLAVLVMSPEPTSLADAYAMVKVLYEHGSQKVQILVNMAVSDKDGLETFDRLNALVVKFLKKPLELLGILLINREIPQFVRKQRLLVMEKVNDSFTLRIAAAARKLSGTITGRKIGFFRKFW